MRIPNMQHKSFARWCVATAVAACLILVTALPVVQASVTDKAASRRMPAYAETPVPDATPWAYLPIVCKAPTEVCQPIPGASYDDTPAGGYPSGDPPAEEHPDLNLSMRGWEANNNAYKGLVDYSGSTDSKAPQLLDLFSDQRVPEFSNVYRVYDWDWANDRRGSLLNTFAVTLAGLVSTPGETVHVPASGYNIGDVQNFEVLVLYADEDSITIKYTREDNVISGYTIHIEGLCVEPTLLALYEENNDDGRSRLPGLVERQALGRARGEEIQVAIRDNGTFMDPRSRKDWWQDVSVSAQDVEQQLDIEHNVYGIQE